MKFIKAGCIIFVVLSLFCACSSVRNQNKEDAVYNNLFDDGFVHEINIEISEEYWQDLRENPTDKTKYEVAVTIDGNRFEHVSVSTKGNQSLAVVARSDSDRYNFKLNFGKFNKGQTYFGLDKLKLSNFYNDPSCLKDHMSYKIMNKAGGYAPLSSFTWLRINGEDFGLYLVCEEIDEGWKARTGNENGILYKPEPVWMDQSIIVPGIAFSREKVLQYFLDRKQYFGGTDFGADLVYIDDDAQNYTAVFDNAQSKVKAKDEKRLIGILKNLSNRENLSSILDTDEIIRYFAAHNLIMNYDSYTGLPDHNYFLLEKDRKLSIAAWDYNDAFGSMVAALHPELTQDQIVNWPIDNPLFDTDISRRPLWAWIALDETYLGEYHDVMDTLITDFFESGRMEDEMSALYDLIRPYIYKDPTFLYSSDDFEVRYEELLDFCRNRAKAIRNQLSATQ